MFRTGERADEEIDQWVDQTAEMPGFAPSPEPRLDPPSDPDHLADDLDDGSVSGEAHTPGSVTRPALDKSAVKAFGEAGVGFVTAAGGLLNSSLKLNDDDDTWIPTEKEADQIGRPLGRIVARHTPLPGGEENATDVVDGIAIAIGLVMYGLRNIGKRARLRKKTPPPQEIPADVLDFYATEETR